MIRMGQLTSSPLGQIWLAVSDHGLIAVQIQGSESDFLKIIKRRTDDPAEFNQIDIQDIAVQLSEYLVGQRREFITDVDWSNFTPFQLAALKATIKIPYGQVRTYSDIAAQIGRGPGAARAIGRAEATNPIPIVIPCHRVVGSNGDLRGYGAPGGKDTKAWLLRLEGHQLAQQQRFPW